jgi:hypothetical protein
MGIPSDHLKEHLQNAYFSAVVARAGAQYNDPHLREYGIDATVNGVFYTPEGYCGSGYTFHCQLKATTTCQRKKETIVYDMEVDAYNKLARWRGPTPIILVLFDLPKDEEQWLYVDEEQFLLRRCCYWTRIIGDVSQNEHWQRIIIHRTQQFTPEAVKEILQRLDAEGDL